MRGGHMRYLEAGAGKASMRIEHRKRRARNRFALLICINNRARTLTFNRQSFSARPTKCAVLRARLRPAVASGRILHFTGARKRRTPPGQSRMVGTGKVVAAKIKGQAVSGKSR